MKILIFNGTTWKRNLSVWCLPTIGGVCDTEWWSRLFYFYYYYFEMKWETMGFYYLSMKHGFWFCYHTARTCFIEFNHFRNCVQLQNDFNEPLAGQGQSQPFAGPLKLKCNTYLLNQAELWALFFGFRNFNFIYLFHTEREPTKKQKHTIISREIYVPTISVSVKWFLMFFVAMN